MNKKLKAKWVAALRSGDYLQGENYLCKFDDNGNVRYCCLGVLAELVEGENAWKSSPKSPQLLGLDHNYTIYGRKLLSDAVINTLIKYNDYGDNFNQIADYIEEKVD